MSPEAALKEFQAALAYVIRPTNHSSNLTSRYTHRKYRYMDQNLAQRRRSLEDKIPDIKKTLSMVEFLQERRVSSIFGFLRFSWTSVCCHRGARTPDRTRPIWTTMNWRKIQGSLSLPRMS